MHHHKAERCARYSAVTVLNLHLPVHALPMPTAWRLILRPSRFLHEERQSRLVLSPGFEFLAHSTGARDSGDQTKPLFQTQAEGAATIGLPLRDNAAHP